jgi:hypothetical protein
MPVSPREVSSVRVHLIGGPTAIVEIGGLRLLTDPTFSGPGPQESGSAVLTKLTGPALRFDDLGVIDAVLLSHDQHGDNLDDAGRQILPRVPTVISTLAASQRLGDNWRSRVRTAQVLSSRPSPPSMVPTAWRIRPAPSSASWCAETVCRRCTSAVTTRRCARLRR